LLYFFSFSNNVDIPTGGVKAKDVVQNVFGQKLFNLEEFLDDEGPLGSHSIQKFGITHIRQCGCSKDERIFRDNERVREGFQMCMMTLSCLIQTQRWLKSCVSEVHAFTKIVTRMMLSKILLSTLFY
jgi:hypothetical protein